MALIVDFNKKIGYYTMVGTDRNLYKIHFCESNSLCSMIYFHKDEKGEKVADLAGFFGDIKHAERCIKSDYFKNCGQRSFYTRKEWIEQCFDWHYGGLPEIEDMDEEEREYYQWLDSMDDEELMHYIQEHWDIEIRETTWLKVGNQCYWKDPADETSGIYTIEEIRYDPNDYNDSLSVDTIILISNGGSEAEVTIGEIYGLTDEVCHKCGHPLYVSDLCSYSYVCLDCDENFC